jgi:hypothetical protein
MAFKTPREIDRRYTRKLKEDILNKALVDTFALYRSIDVTAEVVINYTTFMSNDFEFDIKIYAEPYLVYLNERFTVTWDFINSRSFANTTSIFRRYLIEYLKSQYPMINFEGITMSLRDVIIVNTPDGVQMVVE